MLCAYIAHHKTTAVQEMLFACPRKAKEVAVVLRLKQFRPQRAPMQHWDRQHGVTVVHQSEGLVHEPLDLHR